MKLNGEGSVELAKRSKSACANASVFASSRFKYGTSRDKLGTATDEVKPLSEFPTSKPFFGAWPCLNVGRKFLRPFPSNLEYRRYEFCVSYRSHRE
jgi:hypothetical protein